jgi:hypothetical protein
MIALRRPTLRCALLALCAVLPAEAATAQTASVRHFGQTCGRAVPYGSPTIATGLPRIGALWSAQILGMRAVRETGFGCEHGGLAYLVLGTSNTQWHGVGLPALLPLSMTDGYPCLAQVSVDAVLQGGIGRAGGIYTGTIPNDVSLLGGRVYAQWYVNYWTLWAISCPIYFTPHWVTSDAVELTIGV